MEQVTCVLTVRAIVAQERRHSARDSCRQANFLSIMLGLLLIAWLRIEVIELHHFKCR